MSDTRVSNYDGDNGHPPVLTKSYRLHARSLVRGVDSTRSPAVVHVTEITMKHCTTQRLHCTPGESTRRPPDRPEVGRPVAFRPFPSPALRRPWSDRSGDRRCYGGDGFSKCHCDSTTLFQNRKFNRRRKTKTKSPSTSVTNGANDVYPPTTT